MDVFVIYRKSTTGGQIRAGHENDSYPDHEDAYCDFEVTGVRSTNTGEVYWDAVEIDFIPQPGDIVHVVVVRYGDGDTFGHTNGLGSIRAVFATREEAEAFSKLYPDNKLDTKYCEWDSYFASYERVEKVEISYEA
jgi:hypothetical protein